MYNVTVTSLDVECMEAFDGGQPQRFQIEAYDELSRMLLVNRTSRKPAFILEDLMPGSALKIFIYAYNSKGKSDSITLDGYTLKVAAKQTGMLWLLSRLGDSKNKVLRIW